MRGAGAVYADQDLAAGPVPGQLRQRRLHHGNVIGGGVRACVAVERPPPPMLARWEHLPAGFGCNHSLRLLELQICNSCKNLVITR